MKTRSDASSIYKADTMWLFTKYVIGPVVYIIKLSVAMPTSTAKTQEVCLRPYTVILKVNFETMPDKKNIRSFFD